MSTTINNTQEADNAPSLPLRVTMVERDVKNLSTSMDRQFAEVRADQTANHGELMSTIRGVQSAQAERSKVQWPAIGVICTVLSIAGGLVYYPIKDKQESLSRAIELFADRGATKNELMTAITAEDRVITSALTSIKERRDDQQRVTESRFGRIEADMDGMQHAVVPRGELEANWNAQRARDAELQRQLDDQRTRVESIYSPRDAITSLQRTVEDLQARLNGRKG